jgi:hypothetical protein
MQSGNPDGVVVSPVDGKVGNDVTVLLLPPNIDATCEG